MRLPNFNPHLSLLAAAAVIAVSCRARAEIAGQWLTAGPSLSYVDSTRMSKSWGTGLELSVATIGVTSGGRDAIWPGSFSVLWLSGGADWLHTSPASRL